MTRARHLSNYPNDWVSVKDPKFSAVGNVALTDPNTNNNAQTY